MAIYLEIPKLKKEFPFRLLVNEGDILTTPHWHREIEIIYVVKGTINLGINDQPLVVSTGEIILINSGELHYVLASPGSERIVYQFELQYFTNMITDIELPVIFSELPVCSRDWGSSEGDIQILLDKIYQEYRGGLIGSELAVKAALLNIVTLFIRAVPKINPQVRGHQRVRNEEILVRLDQIFRFVENRYTGNITLEEVANVVGYSQFYFTKFFKKNTGKTFIAFLNDYRIDKAKWLLINTTFDVSEIITRVGFESDKTFYRLFKHSMDISPLAYRRKMKLERE